MSADTIFVLTTDTLPPGFELVEVFGLVETTYTKQLQKGLVQAFVNEIGTSFRRLSIISAGQLQPGLMLSLGSRVSTSVVSSADGNTLLTTHYGTAVRCHIHPNLQIPRRPSSVGRPWLRYLCQSGNS